MKNRFYLIFTLIASSALFLSGCGDSGDSFESDAEPDPEATAENTGVISQKNFSLLTADVNPAVIDGTTFVFTKTDVDVTVYIGDRNNQVLTDSHTINFVAEYGLIEPSCVTVEGTCSVTWSAIKRPDTGGPGSDGVVTITAYTTGEEAFTDSNGNNTFDDADAAFDDLEEPYVDADEGGTFTAGDVIIDVESINDPSGENKEHDLADGFYNGKSCSHTSLCGDETKVTIFDSVTMSIISDPTYSIGGTVTGLPGGGDSVTLQNNAGDDLVLTTNGTFTFATRLEEDDTYDVQVSADAATVTCVATFNVGTVATSNITNVVITCT